MSSLQELFPERLPRGVVGPELGLLVGRHILGNLQRELEAEFHDFQQEIWVHLIRLAACADYDAAHRAPASLTGQRNCRPSPYVGGARPGSA